MPRLDRDTIIDRCWPAASDPTEVDVTSAAVATRELLYYLNNVVNAGTLHEMTTIHTVTTNVGSAIAHSGPVLHQLAQAVTSLAKAGVLTDDRLDRNPNLAASYAAGQLTAARDILGTLYDHLASAAVELSHLHKPHDEDS